MHISSELSDLNERLAKLKWSTITISFSQTEISVSEHQLTLTRLWGKTRFNITWFSNLNTTWYSLALFHTKRRHMYHPYVRDNPIVSRSNELKCLHAPFPNPRLRQPKACLGFDTRLSSQPQHLSSLQSDNQSSSMIWLLKV